MKEFYQQIPNFAPQENAAFYTTNHPMVSRPY